MKSKDPKNFGASRTGKFSRFQPVSGDFFDKKPVFDEKELISKRKRVQDSRARNNTKLK